MSDVKPELSGPISWKSKEFDYSPKTTAWYVIFWGVVVSILFIALWQRNILFVLFTLIASSIVIFWARRKPELLTVTLSENILRVNEKEYALDTFVAYYLTNKVLMLQHKQRFSTYVTVRIQPKFRERIDTVLSKHMSTFEYTESLVDALARIIGF